MKTKKKGVALLLALALLLSIITPAIAADAGTASVPFPDMENHWAKQALISAVDNGLLNGTGGYMRPDAPLTRAQLAAVINRAFGAAAEAVLPAGTDVSADAWYATDMRKAVQMGTFTGDPGGKLRPDDPITRQETFAVLARAFKISSGTAGNLAAFSDAGQVSSWAVDSVAGLVKAGCVAGSDGKLSPTDNITRAQFATMLHRMVSQYITEAGTYEAEDIASEGSVLVRAPGVTLKEITVRGDLIIGDGVGDGDVTLDSVTIEGRVVVRGGGENSIRITGNSSVGTVIVTRVDGIVRVIVSGGAEVEVVYIDNGSDDVIMEGQIGDVVVEASDITVTAANATINSFDVNGDDINLVVGSGSAVSTLTVSAGTSGTGISNAGTIGTLQANGPAAATGRGTVREAVVAPTGSGSSFETAPTSTTVLVGASANVGGQTIDNTSGSSPQSVSAQPLAGGGGGNPPADTTAPTINSLSPTDNAVNVSIGANLVLTFSENVTAVGGKNIYIKKSLDDSIIATIDAIAPQVTVVGAVVTVNPLNDLAYNTGYYVQIESGAFKDGANNNYAGISNKTTWNITTAAAPDIIINIAAIPGVTAPVRGAVPVATITETAQYTGTVAWAPDNNPFAASTVYTATITLTPKAGYTLTGVAENFFTVAGSTSDTNAANTGVVTAVFPATEAAPDVQLTGLTENLTADFAPAFAGGTYAYTLAAANAEATVNITPTLVGATITWDIDTDANPAAAVNSGEAAEIPMTVGANVITVHTEKAGTTAKDYTITVTRADVIPDVQLTGLTENLTSDFVPAFAGGTYAYTLAAANAETAVNISPTLADATITWNVDTDGEANPTAVNSGDSAAVPLTVGRNDITIHVEKAGTTATDYTITVERADVELTGLTESLTADFVPAFAGDIYAYTLAATNAEDEVNITPTLAGATITWDVDTDENVVPTAVASGVAATIPLEVGENIATFEVETAGTPPRSYVITVTRATAVPDVQLTGLTENLTSNFVPDFAGGTYAYTLAATNAEATVNITPTLDGATITWDVNTDANPAAAVNSGEAAEIPLTVGANVITVHTEKAGTTAKDYTITVTRADVLPDVQLTGLTENIAADFVPVFAGGTYAYALTATYVEATHRINITPTLDGATITWNVDTDGVANPTAVNSGEAMSIALILGANVITVHVEKAGTTAKDYVITVTREAALPDVQLTGLTENLTADLEPGFAGGTYAYTLAATNGEAAVNITSTLAEATITWDVNTDANPAAAVASGAEAAIPLTVGANVITVHVEKAGTTARDYTITVTRAALLPDVQLTGLTEGLAADFNPVFVGETYAYTLAATNIEEEVNIMPTLAGATITWNVDTDGEDDPAAVNSGVWAIIPLAVGNNVITIHVEKMGTTAKDYVITVTRANVIFPDVELTGLTEDLAADFNHAFEGDRYAYELAATIAEEAVSIVPTLAGARITWDVNTDLNPATELSSGEAATIPLTVGDNYIFIHVEKEGTTAKTYTIYVTRATPAVQLTGLTENLAADFVPAFTGGTYEYTLAADHLEGVMSFTPTLDGATITWDVDTDGEDDPTAVNSGMAVVIGLAPGPNVITIHVEKAATLPRDYVITVTREILPDVRLDGMTENLMADFNPAFAIDTYAYTLAATDTEATVNIVPSLGGQFVFISWDVDTDEEESPTEIESNATATIPLAMGVNVITIHVENLGTTAKDYVITVNRDAPLPDIQLTELTEDLAADFDSAFAGGTYAYELAATSAEETVNIVPTLAGGTITWNVNTDGVANPTQVDSGAAATIPLALGANIITIHVEKAGTTAKNYVITATRAEPLPVQLTGLTEDLAADFDPAFSGGTYTYELAAANAEATVNIVPTLAGATITWNVDTDEVVNPTAVNSGEPAEIPLALGPNFITIHVEKAGTVAKDYYITVTRAGLPNVELTDLTENLAADFDPAFASGIYVYTLAAANAEATVNIVPTLAGATITWNINTDGEANPTEVNSGETAVIPLVVGFSVITIHVEKEGTTAKDYQIQVTRAMPFPDVQLTGLTEDLSASFNPAFEGSRYTYNLPATYNEATVNIVPALDGATITWDVNTDASGPTTVISGATAVIPLAVGANIITIHIEKAGTTAKDYVIGVTRATPPDVQLTGLTENLAADFNTPFVGSFYTYTTAATNAETTVNIVPTLAGATITWNVDTDGEADPTPVDSGATAAIPLSVGANVITVHVEKEGTVAKDYVITVTRALPLPVQLTGLTEDLIADFDPAFEGEIYNYNLDTTGDETTVSIVPILAGATITWDVDTDGNPFAAVNSGEAAVIPLAAGINIITIHVEKEWTAARDYVITVIRNAPSPDVQLTGLTENLGANFNPAFAGGTYAYTLAATDDQDSVDITPMLDGATITWNVDTDENPAAAVNSGESAEIPLAMGINVITIHVVKEGTSDRNYTITVSRGDVTPPNYSSVNWSNGDSTLTVVFTEDIYCTDAATLKAAITFAGNGTDFVPLVDGDNVRINGQTLIIEFASPVTGTENRIKIPSDTLRDAAGNYIHNEVITADRTPPVYLGATISNLNRTVTLMFNDNIFSFFSTNELLKGEITFSVDGVNFSALAPGDSVSISDANLIIDFAEPLAGATNKIRISFWALEDKNRMAVPEMTTEAISAQ